MNTKSEDKVSSFSNFPRSTHKTVATSERNRGVETHEQPSDSQRRDAAGALIPGLSGSRAERLLLLEVRKSNVPIVPNCPLISNPSVATPEAVKVLSGTCKIPLNA